MKLNDSEYTFEAIYIYVFWVESANLSAFLKHPFEDNRFLSPDK